MYSVCSLSAPPTITSLTFDPDTFTLTCVSTGSPATMVTWMKDGSPVLDGYTATQMMMGMSTHTYDNVLSLPQNGGIRGNYSCEVANTLGKSPETSIELSKGLIIHEPDTHHKYSVYRKWILLGLPSRILELHYDFLIIMFVITNTQTTLRRRNIPTSNWTSDPLYHMDGKCKWYSIPSTVQMCSL